MKRFFSSVALALLPVLVFAKASVFVLAYHTFRGIPADSDIRPDTFESQLGTIRNMGYHFVSIQDILSNRVTGTSNVLITIDDGNVSLRDVYEPILLKFGIKPVLFIYPAITGRVHFSVTFADLKYFEMLGATVGAHGYNHLIVTEKLYRRDPKAFDREIRKSKMKLEEKLGHPVDLYCHPFGAYSPRTLEELEKTGYHYAFTLNPGRLDVPLDGARNPYRLPRYYVTKRSWRWVLGVLKANGADHPVRKKKKGSHAAG